MWFVCFMLCNLNIIVEYSISLWELKCFSASLVLTYSSNLLISSIVIYQNIYFSNNGVNQFAVLYVPVFHSISESLSTWSYFFIVILILKIFECRCQDSLNRHTRSCLPRLTNHFSREKMGGSVNMWKRGLSSECFYTI